jgi:hypothetical protein
LIRDKLVCLPPRRLDARLFFLLLFVVANIAAFVEIVFLVWCCVRTFLSMLTDISLPGSMRDVLCRVVCAPRVRDKLRSSGSIVGRVRAKVAADAPPA